MLLRSAWMVAWLMVSLKTQTFEPNAATVAPGHIKDAGAGAAGLATAAVAGAAASPAPATSTTSSMAGRRRPERGRAGADPNGPRAGMMASLPPRPVNSSAVPRQKHHTGVMRRTRRWPGA